MTLNTRVYVLDEIPYRDVFTKCNQLIGAHEGIKFTDRGTSISNDPGQGLCAWLDVDYEPVPEGGHGKYCDQDDPEESHSMCFPRRLEVSFDTSYGYRGDNGEGCGELHARLVFELGQWLDERGARWKWQNEFTGEIHDSYKGLSDLCSGGANASAWFAYTVAPAIAAMGERLA